jgi:hypothetical protein
MRSLIDATVLCGQRRQDQKHDRGNRGQAFDSTILDSAHFYISDVATLSTLNNDAIDSVDIHVFCGE